jgi:hypothetical protein
VLWQQHSLRKRKKSNHERQKAKIVDPHCVLSATGASSLRDNPEGQREQVDVTADYVPPHTAFTMPWTKVSPLTF